MNYRQHRAGVDAYDAQDVVLGVFDILGFSALVQSMDLDTLGRRYRELLLLKRRAAGVHVMSLSGIDEWSSPSAVFSDTIVFWADAQPEAADSFLTTCSVLLADALDHGWPLRGAISAGRCILDRDARVFVGQPIVHAHVLEQAQDWIGAAIHPSCLDHPVVGRIFKGCDNVVRYSPPLKPEYTTQIDYAVEWSSRTIHWDRKLTEMENGVSDRDKVKYLATRAFVAATRAQALGDAV